MGTSWERGGRSARCWVLAQASTGLRRSCTGGVSVVRVHEPIPANTPLYLPRYAEYERLINVMQTPWEELNKLN